jgi:hypothetical protein
MFMLRLRLLDRSGGYGFQYPGERELGASLHSHEIADKVSLARLPFRRFTRPCAAVKCVFV